MMLRRNFGTKARTAVVEMDIGRSSRPGLTFTNSSFFTAATTAVQNVYAPSHGRDVRRLS